MRLVSYLGEEDGGTGLLVGERVIPLFDGFLTGMDLDPDSLDDFRRRAATLEGAAGISLDDVELVAPLPVPGKIVCVGLNYSDHVAEQKGVARTKPLLFSKFANAVIGDEEAIVRPEGTHALDLEVELGVVIGTTAHRVRREDAMEHVAGYVVVNDVSARDWQGIAVALDEGEVGDGQWLRAKGSDTFLPMGSVLVSADEIPDPQQLRLRSYRIPGSGPDDGGRVLMQDGTTADMIWSVAELIEFISRSITLEPGDIIATGTPSGVGVFRDPPVFLLPGDRARCEIDGIGWVENPIVDWSDEDDGDDADIESLGLDRDELDELIGGH
jgi:2-keto-4-pentenoate hydratase/2-oxohepta-3-ene-1,7-dioic acid hydratase in catechol pathway